MSSAPPLVSLDHITRRFGALVANDDVSLALRPGEIHALLGENGAGKSTLVKILYGLIQPDSGTINLDGVARRIASPQEARDAGIGMVFQHFSLFDNLTVAENIALVLPAKAGLKRLEARILAIAERYGLALDPSRPIWSLSAGERQRVEIVRALIQEPRVLVLDEPTSVLTPQEAETLFATLNRLKAEGKALVYISHKLEEVRGLCDCATILRAGRVVATCDPKAYSAHALAELMMGRDIGAVRPPGGGAGGAVRLRLNRLNLASPDLHGISLKDISLEVHDGEVVGVAGIAGNGQSELFAALSGESSTAPDAIAIDGHNVGDSDINQRRGLDAAFVPEERNGHAAVGAMSLADNLLLSRHALPGLLRHGLIDRAALRARTVEVIASFDVRTSGPDAPARTLSGGNLQKFAVGRELARAPKLLIINQPTWGVDALAAAAIRQAIVDLAAKGAAVLVISQDLDELYEVSDRLCALAHGQLSALHAAAALDRSAIGLLMGGSGHATREVSHVG